MSIEPKHLAWSFSKIEAFELCPKKMYHENIAKDVGKQSNEVQQYGKDGHKYFELYMLKDKALPMDFKHHQKSLDKIKQMEGEGLPEQKLAINENFEPTGWFDSDVYGRAIIDYTVINRDKKHAFIVDWKFGKMKDDFDQISVCAAMMKCFEPELETIIGTYYWAKDKKFTTIKLGVNGIQQVWTDWLDRVHTYQEAVRNTEFPAKQNFLCARHCPVKKCAHNGG